MTNKAGAKGKWWNGCSKKVPTYLPADEPWAFPIAWAKRRERHETVSILQ